MKFLKDRVFIGGSSGPWGPGPPLSWEKFGWLYRESLFMIWTIMNNTNVINDNQSTDYIELHERFTVTAARLSNIKKKKKTWSHHLLLIISILYALKYFISNTFIYLFFFVNIWYTIIKKNTSQSKRHELPRLKKWKNLQFQQHKWTKTGLGSGPI